MVDVNIEWYGMVIVVATPPRLGMKYKTVNKGRQVDNMSEIVAARAQATVATIMAWQCYNVDR